MAIPPMTMPTIAPAPTGFDPGWKVDVELEELFAYVGERIALICSAAPSCQTH
jgi:hypothetical protein